MLAWKTYEHRLKKMVYTGGGHQGVTDKPRPLNIMQLFCLSYQKIFVHADLNSLAICSVSILSVLSL